MSSSMVHDLLDQADYLNQVRPRRASSRRRAVSTAYYAIFHALAKTCSEALLPNIDRTADTYLRTYRALDHGPIRNAFTQSPLKDASPFQELGHAIVELQKRRNIADYMPPDEGLFPSSEVHKLLNQARWCIDTLEGLDADRKLLLSTCLLFKPRKD